LPPAAADKPQEEPMPKTASLDILKQALLLERRGKAFYEHVADQATHPAVRDFFSRMADEEDHHLRILAEQYAALEAGGEFVPTDEPTGTPEAVADRILDAATRHRIDAATFESAAISAAIAMEEKAVRLYTERAESAPGPAEKKLYEWLAEWERHHHQSLVAIDRALMESIWEDNHFWPF
jgi:rubrerythrin